MDKYLAMQSFVRVARAGSFSRAAKALGTNQSSVSRLVQSLEAELGVQLLHRTTRKLSLTEPGQTFLVEASRILSDIDSLTAKTKDLQTVPKGLLRVGMPLAFGRVFIIPKLVEFKRLYPEVTLEISLDDRMIDVVQDGYDLAVRVGRLTDSSHLSRKLAVVDRVLVASPSLWISDQHNPDQLAQLPALLFESVRSLHPNWVITKQRQRREIPIREHVSVNHLDSIAQLARDGLGVALLPSWLVQEDLQRGKLIRVLPEWSVSGKLDSQSAVHAIFPATRKQTAKVRAFVDFLAKAISTDKRF